MNILCVINWILFCVSYDIMIWYDANAILCVINIIINIKWLLLM